MPETVEVMLEMPEMKKTKAIFVDGPSLYNMGVCLGIAVWEFSALFRFLTKEVGSPIDCFGKPVYVLPPEPALTKREPLERSGFAVVPVETRDSADDKEIIKRIEALTADDVSEIILVSANFKDFRECLMAKVDIGMRVILVATKVVDEETKTSMLSTDFDYMRGPIEFVDLQDYKDRLIKRPLLKNRPAVVSVKKIEPVKEDGLVAKSETLTQGIQTAPSASQLVVKTIKLSLEVGMSDLILVLDAVSAVLGNPKVLKSTLEIK